MPYIHVLDEVTINQIAAGEVVERPSAVIKELVENAMDAGATAITAEIKEGGLSFIRITDNGAGIAKEDIPLAFLRHATSKIKTAEDLLTVLSLGFRGEALSSICAIAQVELITKTPSSLNGFRYVIEGGEEKSLEEIGCPGGTTIIIRNLFYNTPARRKFLKSPTTETGYISDLMERLMISHPEVSFKYIVNNQVKLQSAGNNNSKDILYNVYGRDITKELLSVDFGTQNFKITGYIGKPVINRGNRNHENYYINGRYIKSNVITKAIEESYKPFMMQHKYPFTSLYFEIAPELIDVNVHPQKMEIRLKNSEEVYQFTYEAIRSTLSGKEMIPKVLLTHQVEAVPKALAIPEPFEVNRRKEYHNNLTTTTNDKDLQKPKPSMIDGARIINQKTSFGQNNNFSYSHNNRFVDNNDKVAEGNAGYSIDNKEDIIADRSIPDTLNHNVVNISSTRMNSIEDINTISNREDLDAREVDTREVDAKTVDEKAVDTKAVDAKVGDTKVGDTKVEGAKVIETKNVDTKAEDTIAEETIAFDTKVEDTNSKSTSTQPHIETSEQMNLFHQEQEKQEAPFLSKKGFEEHRIIGQVFSTYWLVEYKKELYIIDQHAAHEKVLYERIITAAKAKTYQSQQLLPPIVLTLTLREQHVLQKHEEVLTSLGYEIEPFGGNEYSVRAVPADLYGISEKTLLLDFIDELGEDTSITVVNSSTIVERVASLSCKAAVKANHTFSTMEASELIKELLTLENPYHCPHGRPVIVSMSQVELERKFKRIL